MDGENRLPASTGGAEVTVRANGRGNEIRGSGGSQKQSRKTENEEREKKLSRGASLRGQGAPAYPARLRSERARNSRTFQSLARIQENFEDLQNSLKKLVKTSRKSLQKNRLKIPQKTRRIFGRRKFWRRATQGSGDFPSPQSFYLRKTTFLPRRAEIRSARWRRLRRQRLRRATPCAERGRGSERGRGPPK
jgi:hypothetical protein